MSSLGQDLKYAARMLLRSRGFTIVALTTLAIGIGANTAIFSVVEAVLLHPLPYPEPDRLAAVFQTLPSRGVPRNGVSYLNYRDLASRARSFERLAAIRMHDYTFTGRGEPALLPAGTVSGDTFPVLRAKPLLGRGLTPADDDPASPSVAVLSERLWRDRFGADPGVIGGVIVLDARPSTIVGVMPREFTTPPASPPAELWLSLTHDPVFEDLRKRRGGHYLTLVGRLRPGVTVAGAEAELATAQSALAREYPKENEGWGVRVMPLADSLVGSARTPLLVLLGAVGLVFLIACANVANLLLARSAGRAREVAIRTALGAGRARILRQLLTECGLLALVGGGLGLALAVAATKSLGAWLPADLPRAGDIRVDGGVLLFSLAISAAAALVFGLAPSLQSTALNLSDPLREGAAGSGESAGKRRLRGLLVVAETGLSFVLLVGAGLLGRSFLRLESVRLGFEPRGVLTGGLSLPRAQYSKPSQWISFYTRLVERLKALPGVESAAGSLPLPLYGGGLNFAFQIEGRAPAGSDARLEFTANYTAATPDYFHALGVRPARGRVFTDADSAESPKVCLVSSAFARAFFPGEDPVGRRLVFGFTDSVPREIVGVVNDVKRDGLGAPSKPEMYVPFVQDPWWASYVVVKTTGDPERLANAVREQVRALDPDLPIDGIQPMTRTVSDSVAQPRFRTALLALFSGTALLLAVVGIYGVLAYAVGRRTRELGIRIALGADRGDILRLVAAQGLKLTAAGLAAGIAVALVATRFLATLLFEVPPLDLATWAAVAVLLFGAGALACVVPARRAVRVDPAVALRHE